MYERPFVMGAIFAQVHIYPSINHSILPFRSWEPLGRHLRICSVSRYTYVTMDNKMFLAQVVGNGFLFFSIPFSFLFLLSFFFYSSSSVP